VSRSKGRIKDKRADTRDLAHTMFLHLFFGGNPRVFCGACHRTQRHFGCAQTAEKQCIKMEHGKCDRCGKRL